MDQGKTTLLIKEYSKIRGIKRIETKSLSINDDGLGEVRDSNTFKCRDDFDKLRGEFSLDVWYVLFISWIIQPDCRLILCAKALPLTTGADLLTNRAVESNSITRHLSPLHRVYRTIESST